MPAPTSVASALRTGAGPAAQARQVEQPRADEQVGGRAEHRDRAASRRAARPRCPPGGCSGRAGCAASAGRSARTRRCTSGSTGTGPSTVSISRRFSQRWVWTWHSGNSRTSAPAASSWASVEVMREAGRDGVERAGRAHASGRAGPGSRDSPARACRAGPRARRGPSSPCPRSSACGGARPRRRRRPRMRGGPCSRRRRSWSRCAEARRGRSARRRSACSGRAYFCSSTKVYFCSQSSSCAP